MEEPEQSEGFLKVGQKDGKKVKVYRAKLARLWPVLELERRKDSVEWVGKE